MKILGAHIYGYGKLENLEMSSLAQDIQVFYGQNEAGKSTLMSFIHSILFGFPTRVQQEQRYIPKTGTKYGGKLIVQTDEYGTLMIERIPGKAAGDVTVFLPNGTTKGEEFLSELFKGMDKTLYQSIYSFNVHGLQNVHQLRSEDLGKFLFSSGAVGTDSLMNLHQKLTKEMDTLFKPNGKKPLLNHSINGLKEENNEIVKWKEKNATHQALLEQQYDLHGKLTRIQIQKEQMNEQIREAEKLQNMQPIVEEYVILKNQLDQLPKYEPFPEDGLKRLDQLLMQLQPYEAQLNALITQQKEWNNNIEALNISTVFIENEHTINNLMATKSHYEEKQYRLNTLNETYSQMIEDIQNQKSLINVNANDEGILQFDTSISAKEKISSLVAKVDVHHQQKKYLDESFTRAKDELEKSEIKMKEYEKEILSKAEREYYEEIVRNEEQKEYIVKEKKYLEEELSRIDQKLASFTKKGKKNVKKTQMIFALLGVLLLLSTSYTVINKDWMLSIIFLFVFVLLLPAYKMINSQSSAGIIEELKSDKHSLQEKLATLSKQFSSDGARDYKLASDCLVKDKFVRQQLEVEKSIFVQIERSYEKVLEGYEEWEKDKFEIEEKGKKLKIKYSLPTSIASDRLLDVYQIIDSLKQKINQRNQIEEQIQIIKGELERYHQTIIDACSHFQIPLIDYSMAIDEMVKRLTSEKKKQEQFLQLDEKLTNAKEQIEKLQLEVTYIKNECKALWDVAEVNNEEEFRTKGHAFKKANQIQERMAILKSQFARYGDVVEKCNLEENYQQTIQKLSDRINESVTHEKEYQRQLSETMLRIEELEEGGTYADLFHSFEGRKSAAREVAKKWASYAVAKDILNNTIDEYRNKRLPMVIKKATAYFQFLTEGKYQKIFAATEDEGFIVENANGIRYKPNELSQATTEQLYISLRFALANTMHPNHPFPFIIDDSFVNFDANRLDRVIELLKEICNESQVIFFTCHQHVANEFCQEKVICL